MKWLKNNLHQLEFMKQEVVDFLLRTRGGLLDSNHAGTGSILSMTIFLIQELQPNDEIQIGPLLKPLDELAERINNLENNTMRLETCLEQDEVDRKSFCIENAIRSFQLKEYSFSRFVDKTEDTSFDFNESWATGSSPLEYDVSINDDLEWDKWSFDEELPEEMQVIPQLSDDEIQKLEDLQEKLVSLEEEDFLTSQIQLLYSDVSIICESNNFEEIQEILKLSSFSDVTILKLTELIITENLSYNVSFKWMKYALLERITNLKAQASRTLMNSLIHCAKIHPNALIESTLIPVMMANYFEIYHSETIYRVIKEVFSAESVNMFLKVLTTLIPVSEWKEPYLDLIQKIILLQHPLSQEIIHNLLKCLDANVVNFKESKRAMSKLSTLLFHIVTKCDYGSSGADIICKIASESPGHMSRKILTIIGEKSKG